jgi:hypothetical protein
MPSDEAGTTLQQISEQQDAPPRPADGQAQIQLLPSSPFVSTPISGAS